jgi:hypothetical protein
MLVVQAFCAHPIENIQTTEHTQGHGHIAQKPTRRQDIAMVSSKRTRCDSDLLLYQPLLAQDLVLHHLHHHDVPFLLVPQQKPRISIQNRKQPRQTDDESESLLADNMVGDVAVGTGVTFCVAPFLTVVDKAIVQRAAGTHSLWISGLETLGTIARNPIRFIKSPTFLWMWGVYAATYSTANILKTHTEHSQQQQERAEPRRQALSPPSSGLGVFLGISAVNSGGSLLKDRAYAQMFGTVAKRSIPKISYGLWMTRDFLVVGSSFILPDLVAKQLPYDTQTSKQVAQITMPVAMQFIAGPLQLLGLDCYNRSLSEMTTRQAVFERGRFLANGFTSIVSARIARIIPGYSIGGVLNTKFRDQWRAYLLQRETSPVQSVANSLLSRNRLPSAHHSAHH